MNDPALTGASIMRKTLCKEGAHTFVWSGAGWDAAAQKEPNPTEWCCCGSYMWFQWKHRMQEQEPEVKT